MEVPDDLWNDTILCIAGGSTTTFAASEKVLYGWGTPFHQEISTKQGKIAVYQWHISVRSIACGSSHVLVCTTDASCYWWGKQFNRSESEPQKLPKYNNSDLQALQVAAGNSHSLLLDKAGKVYTWGLNEYGQCGANGEGIRGLDCPQTKQVSAGANHSAIVTCNGLVYTFGWGLYHQLGHGTTSNCLEPTCVNALEGVGILNGSSFSGVVKVSCGAWHTAALTATGEVYTWGWGQHGQLGHKTLESQPFPTLLDVDWDVKDVSCGVKHTTILSESGQVHRWGMTFPSPEIAALKSSDINHTHRILVDSDCHLITSGAYHDVTLEISQE